MSWWQVAVIVFGAVLLAAAALETSTLLDLRRRDPADRLGAVVLLIGAVDLLGAGLAFVAGGVLRNKWLVLLGASLLVLRFFVFRRWFLQWPEPEAEPEPYEQPRPLTDREREILDFLLTADLPGIEELREQADTAVAVRWGARDPSFDVDVDREATRPSPLRTRPAIMAETKRKDVDGVYSLMLWVDEDGWLSGVEFTPFGDTWLEVLLPPSEFEPPGPYERGRVEP